MLQRLYERTYAALAPHRRAVAVATVLALAFCFWRAARMTPDEDITSFLPSGDATVDAFRLVAEGFHEADQLFFDVGPDDSAVAGPADITAAADALNEELEASGLFRRVRYRMSPEQGLALLDWLDAAKPALFGADDRAALEALLTPTAVAERLDEARRRLLEPEGVLQKDMLRRDPLGLRALFLAKLAALQGGADVRFAGGRIWSADGRHVLLIAEPTFPSSDTLKSERLFAAIDGAVAAARAAGPAVQVRYAGGHRAARDNRALVREDLGLASVLSVVAIAALVWLGFRRRVLVLLSFAPVLFGFMSAVAVFSFFTDRAALVIFGSASIFAGLTTDYAIYTLYRFDNLPAGADAGRALSPLASPLLLGAATTAAAFASLAVSVLPGQRTLGVFSALGVMSAALFALVVLPHLLPAGGAARARSILPMAVWHARLVAWLRPRRRGSVAAVALLTAVAALGVARLRFDGDLRHLNGVRPETLRDEEALLAHWGGALASTAVVVRGHTPAAALARNEQLAGTLAQLRDTGEVRSFATVAPLLPSPETAAANRARWRDVWSESRRAELARVMATEGRRLGFSDAAFAPFWADLESMSETDPIGAATGQGPLAALLSPQLAVTPDEALVLTRVEVAPERLAAVTARVQAEVPGTLVVNGRALALHVTSLVTGGLVELAATSLALVTFLVWLFLRRPGHVLAVLVPVAFDVFWTLGALGLLGLTVNLMNSLFIGLVFGVASDYAIFIAGVLRDGQEDDVGVTGAAVTLCALTTLAGFGVLTLARHPVLFAMGVTSLVGVALGLVASLLIVPLLLPRPAPATPRALEEAA